MQKAMILAALAMSVGLTAQTHAQTVTVLFDPGITNTTTALTGFGTTGDLMAGMDVTAFFADGTSESVVWTSSGFPAGAATGTGWSLTQSGDTFFFGRWRLNNNTGQSITRVLIDAGPGNTVFDTRALGDIGGTPGSARGQNFTVLSGLGSLDIVATYRDGVALAGFGPVGDLFRFLDIQFTNGGGYASGAPQLQYRADTDNILFAGDLEPETVFLLIDEDSIDNGDPLNFFSDVDVNDDIADIGLRAQLPFFAANFGATITLFTGEVGDEGWFALKTIPVSWAAAGPTADGLCNFLGVGNAVGLGLGAGNEDVGPEDLLDKIPDVTPLRATGLNDLVGARVCAVVFDSDISINYDPLDGSLKGANLGIVAFGVISVTARSDGSLPEVEIEILDAEDCDCDALTLFLDAPEPISSSEPFDVD